MLLLKVSLCSMLEAKADGILPPAKSVIFNARKSRRSGKPSGGFFGSVDYFAYSSFQISGISGSGFSETTYGAKLSLVSSARSFRATTTRRSPVNS